MPSKVIEKIRSLDKGLRDEFQGQALFQVTFGKLRDCTLSEVEEVEDWYQTILSSNSYINLRALWRENSIKYWKNVKSHHSCLPEYQTLKHLKMIFVAECRKTMPKLIQRLTVCHLCGESFPTRRNRNCTCDKCAEEVKP